MSQSLFKLRYYLEIIALPVFAWLVIHLSGHGLALFMEDGHDHGHHNHSEHGHGEHHEWFESMIDQFFTTEFLSGIILLGLFVYLWHQPFLKKWVPCSHDHCHGKLKLSHTLAIGALCLHFFPEAVVRHKILAEALHGEIFSFVGMFGFAAHFLVDIIIAIVISGYFKKQSQFWLSLSVITFFWLIAFFSAESFFVSISSGSEGVLYLISGFLLAMFVHKPHKPVICKSCTC
jgi:hypothetical protein